MSKPHFVILGGGYAAVTATQTLRKAILKGELDVTVITRENYHNFHGFAAEMITGRILPSQILSPVRRIFPPANVLVAEITAVDVPTQTITFKRQIDGIRSQLHYDHLLVALGASDNLEAYPGLREHGFRLHTYDGCLRLRSQLITMFELASLTTNTAERRRLLTFVIAGGGYAGTEIAGEIADLCRLLTEREYKHIRREECRVLLITPGATILPELYSGIGAAGYGDGYPQLVAYAMRHMAKLGVEVRINSRVAWVTPLEVGLVDGERIPTRTVVSAVGKKPAALVATLPVPHDERGRIHTDSTLRVPSQPNIWAAGDCAAIPNPNNPAEHICPANAAWAVEEGKVVAQNVLRVVRGEEPRPFTYKGLGQGASIGRRTGVGEFRGWQMRGLFSWLMWRMLLVMNVPTWDRRLRLLADWLIWPLVGRDIVEMSVDDADDYEISHHVFQAEVCIIEENQVGDYYYLIEEGQAEVRDTETGATRLLGPNDYFGQHPHEMVTAKTQLRVVTIRADQLHQLQAIARPLLEV